MTEEKKTKKVQDENTKETKKQAKKENNKHVINIKVEGKEWEEALEKT